MDNLNFYIVDVSYVSYLKKAETEKRGFSRIPNIDYGKNHKQKFLCGVVLTMNGMDYYVPVSSYKIKKPDNFLICANDGRIVSSLRFNYMFPVPAELLVVRFIDAEPDAAYKILLSQELRYCIKNQELIRSLAERTYKRVKLGKNPGLVANSCDFTYLEQKCKEYQINQCRKKRLSERISAAQKRVNPVSQSNPEKKIKKGYSR